MFDICCTGNIVFFSFQTQDHGGTELENKMDNRNVDVASGIRMQKDNSLKRRHKDRIEDTMKTSLESEGFLNMKVGS